MGGQFVVDLLRQRFKLFNKIIEAIQEVGKVESEPKMEGKQMMMMLAPLVSK